VVEPLEKHVRELEQAVTRMRIDAQRTKPETKAKERLTKKQFLEMYNVSTMDEANTLYKKKNADWADAANRLVGEKMTLKKLATAKEKRAQEWSRAVTRSKEQPTPQQGDKGADPIETLNKAKAVTVTLPEDATMFQVSHKPGQWSDPLPPDALSTASGKRTANTFIGTNPIAIRGVSRGKGKTLKISTGEVKIKDKQTMTPLGADVAAGQSLPTIEDQISGNPLAPKREVQPAPDIEPQNKETINSFGDAVNGAITKAKGWLGGMAGKTFPRTALISKQLSELGARWISSKIAARPKAELFTAEVMGDSGLSTRDVGAALTEDNLRSVKKAYNDKGDGESAAAVQTIIGKKGSPFKDERAYQDFLSDPRFQKVVERYKDMWKATVEPQYKSAMSIEPDVELPSRGLQTSARVNLRAVREGETPRNVVRTTAQGNLLGTLRKKSPFGVQATGAADAYHTDLNDLMENTFGKQDEIANKNAFEKALVDSGNAIIDKPGQRVMIGGKPAVAFPLKRQTVIVEGGKSVAQNRMLYVNQRIAPEYRIAAKVDPFPDKGVLAFTTKGMNTVAIASGTEATTHIMNLGSALFALPSTSGRLLNDAFLSAFGRADIPVKVVQIIRKSMQDNRAQIAGLSEIGAMREQHTSTTPGLKYGTQLIQWMDRNTRLLLDDAYQRMKKDGLVDPSETARREFVNQVGQYNMRAQPYFMGKARQLGLSPFVTAGKNFNTLGIREATLNPGVKATSVPAAIALRANMLSKWIGVSALICTANYLLTKDKGGGVMGRPGTPLGNIDTGQKDKNGRNIYINVLNITGQGRALRVTGLKGAIDAERMGLGVHNAMDSASRDMINSAISPWAGPVPRFALGAATGQSTAVNVGRQFPVVPPGTSQHLSDFRNAVINLSPVTGGIQKAMQPQNQGWWEIIKSQFPRLVPQSGRPDSMTANFPEIVQKAQANEFIDYVIHAARTVPIAQRHQFLDGQIQRLPDELQKKAWTEVKWKKAMEDGNSSAPHFATFQTNTNAPSR
jgi:hypothetical protein